MKRFDVLSLFPEYFQGPFDVSLIGRAKERGLIEINLINIRDYAKGRYRQVDDRPYGGGPGMVLMAEPIAEAIRSTLSKDSCVIYLSPQGKPLTAKRCEQFAKKNHLILLCGHYEGVDERVIESEVDEEVSIGDYVLTSGAPAAIVFIDAVSRFIPGVIGNRDAVWQDSFQNGLFDAPVYTRPSIFEGARVPPVLREGNHAEIEAWRLKKAKEKTKQVRPELDKQLVGDLES